MKKLLKKMKNEKVAKGRLIGLAGPCWGFHGIITIIFKDRCRKKENHIFQKEISPLPASSSNDYEMIV